MGQDFLSHNQHTTGVNVYKRIGPGRVFISHNGPITSSPFRAVLANSSSRAQFLDVQFR